MTVRQHWICAGIALAALYVGLFAGRLGGKHAADRWYAEHPITRYGMWGMTTSTCVGPNPCTATLDKPTACVINGEIRFDVGCTNPLPVRQLP